VNVHLLEPYPVEQGMNQHLYVSSYKNVRHDEDAVETTPLLLRDFNAILDQIQQDVLEVRNPLFLILFASDVQSSVGDHLHQS
jgi:hypothetical protein